MAECKSLTNSKNTCRFHLLSSCRLGDECQFSHDASSADLAKHICQFFLKGDCKFGDNCWFLHCPSYKLACRFFLKGYCKFGDNCWFLHSLVEKDVNAIVNSHEDEQVASETSSRTMVNPTPKQDANNNIDVHTEPNSASYPPDFLCAPEIVPKVQESNTDATNFPASFLQAAAQKLCVLHYNGVCTYNDTCPCIHGDFCELCRKYCLHPSDDMKRKHHIEYCRRELVKNMQLSFGIQRSGNKICGICMDVIIEKDLPEERLFGILEKCNHVYCLSCIRTWRSVEIPDENSEALVEPVVKRACPECRVSSHFIIPSEYWVQEEEEKKELIANYKLTLSKIHCNYFKQGEGHCPFGGFCLYLHARPDGTKVDLPLPARRRRQNQAGRMQYMDQLTMWGLFTSERSN